MENLQRSITALAFLKAEENVRLVRTTGRESVEEFVEEWLMRSFSDGSNYQVRVVFPGESPPRNSDEGGLTLERRDRSGFQP
jgi:hypothetical protein